MSEQPVEKKVFNLYEFFRNGVVVKDSEPLEYAIKRFKKEVANAGILTELKKREYFEKPSVTKKKLRDAAVRKRMKKRVVFGSEG